MESKNAYMPNIWVDTDTVKEQTKKTSPLFASLGLTALNNTLSNELNLGVLRSPSFLT